MIFSLLRSAGVPILQIDQLKTPLGTVDIGLIRDEANEFAPRKGPLQRCLHLVKIWLILQHMLERLRRLLQQPLKVPLDPLAQPLSVLWSRFLGS